MSVVPITQNKRPVLPPSPEDTSPLGVLEESHDLPGHDRRFVHTPLSALLNFVEPTWRHYIRYVDAEARAGTADAQRYMTAWISLSDQQRRRHVPEQICEMISLPADHLVRWVTGQAFLEGTGGEMLVKSFKRAHVLAKTAQYAMESPDNYKDRELFMKSASMIPVAGRVAIPAQPVNFFNMPVASSSSVVGVKSESAPVALSGLRGMDEEIVELSRVMQTGDVPKYGDPDPDDDDDEEDDPDEDDEE